MLMWVVVLFVVWLEIFLNLFLFVLFGCDLFVLVVLKVKWYVLLFVLIMFIVNYIDCVNVGFVDCYFEVLIGIGVVVYGFGVGLFFVGYVLFEVLLNLLM